MTSMTSSASGWCVCRRVSRSSAFCLRVEAEGLVVEPDDCVVRRDRGAQEALPVLVDAERAERLRPWRRTCRGRTAAAGRVGRSAGGARRASRARATASRRRRPGGGGRGGRGPPSSRWPSRGSPGRRSGTPGLAPRPARGRRGCPWCACPRVLRGLAAAGGPRLHGDLEPRGPGLRGRGTWCARPGSPAGARSRRRRARAARPRPHREVRRPPAARSRPGCSPASRRCPWSREASGRPARPGRDPRPRAPRRSRPCRPTARPSGPLGRSRVRVLEAGSASYDEGVVTRSVPPAKVDAMT